MDSISNNSSPKKESKKHNPFVKDTFEYFSEKFADIKILRYHLPEFDKLSLQQKKLIYYLSMAALCGRDIIYDQNYKYNLIIRKTLENIFKTYKGNRETSAFKKFTIFLKRFWFSNGIHHHYSTDKIHPDFSKDYFRELLNHSDKRSFPRFGSESESAFTDKISELIFNKDIAPKRVCQDTNEDLIKGSSNNFYENITQKEVETFYESLIDKKDNKSVAHGLNSKICKEKGVIIEKRYTSNGMYGKAITEIIKWLKKAMEVAENELQEKTIRELIKYYETGDLKTWDQYNILWVQDTKSLVDFVNGFIEIYGDPLGMKATWESVVNYKNIEATKRTKMISDHAQWFENHSPIDKKFRKKNVTGVSAKVINAAQLGGDCHPSTPIGINLPNSAWIRQEHGSKSVTIENIIYAYHQASLSSGVLEEFCFSQKEIALAKKHAYLSGVLHTDMHECLGHGSGQTLPGVKEETLKNYYSPIEEARADLFALYFLMDPKMISLGLLPSMEAAQAEYNAYIRNGLLLQLTRIDPGKDIEQAHMRCRQLIAKWAFEKGKKESVIIKKQKNQKTYFVVNDHQKLRLLFGRLLRELQRIKSEGDYAAGKEMVETFGVKVDQKLHNEVLERYRRLGLAPYAGFINPEFEPITNNSKEITDVKVKYPINFAEQMLKYSKNHSYLPQIN